MATLIEDELTDQMIAQMSRITHETAEEAVQHAVKERLDRLAADDKEAYIVRLRAITSRIAALPILDNRTPDEIIGYNEHGVFD